jgi:hypothetical protein
MPVFSASPMWRAAFGRPAKMGACAHGRMIIRVCCPYCVGGDGGTRSRLWGVRVAPARMSARRRLRRGGRVKMTAPAPGALSFALEKAEKIFAGDRQAVRDGRRVPSPAGGWFWRGAPVASETGNLRQTSLTQGQEGRILCRQSPWPAPERGKQNFRCRRLRSEGSRLGSNTGIRTIGLTRRRLGDP